MNKPQLNLKLTRSIKIAFTFLVLQLTIVNNVYAIKLLIDGEPSQASGVVLNLSENVVYSYSNSFRPIVTNTDSPYLCLGPNLGLGTTPNVSFAISSSDPFRVYGLVAVASSVYDYTPANVIDKTVNITTSLDSQCVVKGYAKTINASPGSPFVFADGFEVGGTGIPLVSPDLDISLLDASGSLLMNPVLTDANDFTYMYRIENIGDTAITFDVVDYFSQVNNSTVWSCVKSAGADVATSCGGDAQNPAVNMGTSITYNQAVYLKDAHIEVTGDAIIITVTRNPSIALDGTSIDLLATALITGQNDIYKLNNSDTRVLIGNTNAIPTIATVADQIILEDSIGTGNLAFAVDDLETPAANLIVTATSSDQNIVADANITIGGSGMNRTVSVDANADANTAFGSVTITLQVADANGGIQTSGFLLNITPVNDKPTFTVPTIADFPAGTTGNQGVSNFIQNVVFGPTTDENSQTLLGNPIITNVSDTNGVLNSAILPLGTSIVLDLSGQGGTVTFDVQIQDDGTTNNGGTDTSDPVNVSFTVLNTLPTISMVSNTSTNEDNSTAAIAFTVSDLETAAGSLTMTAMSSDTSIVPISGIQFGGSGGSRTVQISPALNQNTTQIGVVTISLVVNDGSGTSQATFDLTINPVNDAPTFSLGANINNVVADMGSLISVLNYTTALSMGPTGDEDLNQNVLNYNIQVTDASSIFDQSTVAVDINNNGTLNYVLTGNTGTATIQVSLQDDGATANGGVDTSANQSFTITVQ